MNRLSENATPCHDVAGRLVPEAGRTLAGRIGQHLFGIGSRKVGAAITALYCDGDAIGASA